MCVRAFVRVLWVRARTHTRREAHNASHTHARTRAHEERYTHKKQNKKSTHLDMEEGVISWKEAHKRPPFLEEDLLSCVGACGCVWVRVGACGCTAGPVGACVASCGVFGVCA